MTTTAPAPSSSSANTAVTSTMRRKPLAPASNLSTVRGAVTVRSRSSLEPLHEPAGHEDGSADRDVATEQGLGQRQHETDGKKAQAEPLHDLGHDEHRPIIIRRNR